MWDTGRTLLWELDSARSDDSDALAERHTISPSLYLLIREKELPVELL